MVIKGLRDEDFTQYKKPSMFVIMPYCSFKCDKENGNQYCQNWALKDANHIEIQTGELINRYMSNPISQAIVFGGLEPFDSWDELASFIMTFRQLSSDDIVIYTGYYKNEIEDKVQLLKTFQNIIIKYGRYKPNQKSHRDEVLGVDLANDEQYAEKIS